MMQIVKKEELNQTYREVEKTKAETLLYWETYQKWHIM